MRTTILDKIYLLLVMLTISITTIHAEDTFAQKMNLTQINMSKGLPHNYVDAMLKDSHGFVWIATAGGGVAKYDGYEFITYDISTHVHLSNNFTHDIAEDKCGRIWIASDGGIDILDCKHDRMVKDEIWPEDKLYLTEGIVRSIKKDKNGVIWFAKDNAIIAAECNAQGDIVSLAEYVSKTPITSLENIKGKVWFATEQKVYELILDKHIDIKQIEKVPQIELPNNKGYIITALYHNETDLWIGTDIGLIRVNMATGMHKLYVSNPHNNKSLSQNRITDIVETPNHELIISTLKGINVYNALTDNFEQVCQGAMMGQKSLSTNFINCMMMDQEILWLGTEICGIDLLVPNELAIQNYIHTDNPSSIAANPVNAITEDREGNLWVGNVESGISLKRPNTEKFEHLTVENHGLAHNSISTLTIDSENHLWAGTWGNGISVLDLNQSNYPIIYNPSQFDGMYIGAIVNDPINGGVWVTTTERIYYIKNGNIMQPINDERTINLGGAIGGEIDDANNMWLGTEKGLIIIDLKSMKGDSVRYNIIDHKLDDPLQKVTPRVTYIHKGHDGTMYVGTNGYGLCYRKPGNNHFESITWSDGLINNTIKGIAEDSQGYIWVSTNCGLSFIDMRGNRISSYTTANGLIDDCFYWNAAYVSKKTGNLFFGHLGGLVEITRGSLGIKASTLSAPTFTALSILNTNILAGSEYLSEAISYTDKVKMHERDKSFTIEFAALNYRNANSVIYQYKLVGFDTQWIEASANHRAATYTNLPPGDYELQLCSTDGHGNWSEVAKLSIEVVPYFYKTYWFYLTIFIIVALALWQIDRARVRNLVEQQRLLNILVKERTEELEKQNIVLSEQNVKITQQKESIEEMSAKIQKLSIDKIQFFTNISHEIRTPITLILGPIKRAIAKTHDEAVAEQLKMAEKSSLDLLQIVNQLMDFRKVETGNMELRPTNEKIVPFVKDLIHPFAVFASERNVLVRSFFRIRTEMAMFDTDAMNKVLSNLLSNAVKYTSDCGRVDIFMATIIKEDREMLYINVRDTGNGIPKDELVKIFESYYQSDNHKKALVYGQSGTGIGLYLCRKIVNQLNGEIWAKNNKGKGCSMRILVPFTEGIPANEEAKAERIAEETDVEEIESINEDKKHILIVEDNYDMRHYMRTILEDTYDIYEAKNGVEGLTVLAENDVDFIICDLMMPVMDGLEFAEKVKNNFSISHIPILILTAQMSDEYRTKSYKIGVESYLHKPFDEQMLLARISGILDGRKSNQQKFQYTLNTDDLEIDRESEDEKFVKQVLELVEKNYKNADYSIDDILKSMSCSKSMLNKKMQSVIGQPPGVFIRSYRLNIAKQLIILNRESKNLNISQIAYEVGFNDPKYFTRCFTKHFGVTPSVLLEGSDN